MPKQKQKRKNNNPSGLLDEQIIQSISGRYVDFLILKRFHDLTDRYERYTVARLDPIANRLTIQWSKDACARMIKFYDADEINAEPRMEDLRSALDALGFMSFVSEVMERGQIDGWWIEYLYVTPENMLKHLVFSDKEVLPNNWLRMGMDNTPYAWRVYYRPDMVLGRGVSNCRAITTVLSTSQVIHGWRGAYNWGFGESQLEGCWDSITKLRERSHSNASRCKNIPWVIYPPDWSPSQIDDFMQKLASADEMTAMAMRATTDNEGNPVDTLPKVVSSPMGAPANAGTSSQGTEGDLESEFTRLCVATRHTSQWLVGAGQMSASMSAGGEDKDTDLETNIQDFNLYRNYIKQLVMYFCTHILNYPLPESFTIKGHWEWERDERYLNQKAEAQAQRASETPPALSDQTKDNVLLPNATDLSNQAVPANYIPQLPNSMMPSTEPQPLLENQAPDTSKPITSIYGVRLNNHSYDSDWDMHPLLQEYGSISAMAKGLHHSKETVYKLLAKPWEATRQNSTLLGNSFSPKNPFFYRSHDHPYVEYQCIDAIRAMIGKSAPIIVGHDSADETTLEPHENAQVGMYRIIGFDEDAGHEIAQYDIDDAKLTAYCKDHPEYAYAVKNGKLNPNVETSTGYFCDVRWDAEKKKRIQVNFNLKHLALVPQGNCTPDFCNQSKQ